MGPSPKEQKSFGSLLPTLALVPPYQALLSPRPIAPMVMPIVGMKMIGSVAPALTAGAAGVVVEILPLGSGAFCARGVAVKTKPAVRLMCEEVSVVQLDDFLGWTRGSSDLRESIRALKTSRNLSTKR